MINKAGKAVAPGSDTVQAAAASADWNSVPGFGVILANQPGDKSWPMAAATWILMYKKPEKMAESAEALKFFAWAYTKGDAMADSLDYVPMPQNVVNDIMKMWAAEIKDASGKPLYSPTN
jgi:phosphate transport system substrate-binding protein